MIERAIVANPDANQDFAPPYPTSANAYSMQKLKSAKKKMYEIDVQTNIKQSISKQMHFYTFRFFFFNFNLNEI